MPQYGAVGAQVENPTSGVCGLLLQSNKATQANVGRKLKQGDTSDDTPDDAPAGAPDTPPEPTPAPALAPGTPEPTPAPAPAPTPSSLNANIADQASLCSQRTPFFGRIV